jgi:PAT family beta-lactamase induction signal transducer AmpG
MDVTNPAVAATQFTAYMALCNLAIATSATWQGVAIEAFGYPATMLMDSGIGLLFLLLLTQLRVRSTASALVDPVAPTRTRMLCQGLGVLGVAWLPVYAAQAHWGTTGDIIRLFFNLIAVASAVVLLAASVLLRTTRPRISRVAMLGAGLLLGMLVIKLLASQTEARFAGLWPRGVELLSQISLGLAWGAPLIAALLLLYLSRHDWGEILS